MQRRHTTGVVIAMACVATQACEHRRSAPEPEDWRGAISFTYPAAMDARIVIATRAVWGTHVRSLALLMPGDAAGGPGVAITMAAGHACAPGPVHRFVLEAGQALVEHGLARVVCRAPAASAGGEALEVEVRPYIAKVARALGYSFEDFIAKGFRFQGIVTGPGYLKKTFPDRFAFVEYTMNPSWVRRKHYGTRVPALAVRRDRTVLVISFSSCEVESWLSAWFENGRNNGSDLTYYWATGGGRFVVCEGPKNRYLLGMPKDMDEIGLTDVKGFWECVEDSIEEQGGPWKKDIEFSCN